MNDTSATDTAEPTAQPAPLRTALRTALPAWLISRGIVLATLAGTRTWFDDATGEQREVLRRGLRAWDAAFYIDIAHKGYDGIPADGLRFFPLLPYLGRGLAAVTPFGAADGVVLVANAMALAALVALFRWVSFESDERTARVAVWTMALAPPAFVLVMGYAESLLILAAASCLLASRRGRWIEASGWAFLGGLSRPTGLLLAVPLLIEAGNALARRCSGREAFRATVAVAGAPLGCISYLLAVRDLTPSFLTPLRLHDDPSLRGGTRNPIAAVADSFGDLVSGERFASGIHFVTAMAVVAMLVVLWRHAPRSIFAYGAASVMLGLSAHNLDSFERYVLATPPLVFAAALAVRAVPWPRLVLALSAVGMVALGSAAFAGNVVP